MADTAPAALKEPRNNRDELRGGEDMPAGVADRTFPPPPGPSLNSALGGHIEEGPHTAAQDCRQDKHEGRNALCHEAYRLLSLSP